MDGITVLGFLLGIACAMGLLVCARLMQISRKYTVLTLRVIKSGNSYLLDGLED